MIWGPIVGETAAWVTTQGLTGVVAATTAWALFKWLGRKWIEDRFSKELEAFKAAKQVELERLRIDYARETERLKADLNRFADRASRFHSREYVVLPEAWGLMNKAHGAAASAISALQRYPDLDRMGPSEFAAWLEKSDLEKYEKDQLISKSEKNPAYNKIRESNLISEAFQALPDFSNYLILQGVFIDEILSSKMTNSCQVMQKALVNRQMAQDLGNKVYTPGQTNFWQLSDDGIQSVEAMVLEIKLEIRNLLSNIRLGNL